MSWGKENQREFPWRENNTSAYKIFISEFLLRKTQARTVVPVYQILIRKYPTIIELSKSSVSDLEKIIRPLGLQNIRSRALKEIGEIITNKYEGSFPNFEKKLIELPHCGRYIANALLCFHFKEDKGIVDANIERLLTRHFNFKPVVEIHKADHMWSFMDDLVPAGKADVFNYAILDYCALICKSSECLCGDDLKF